MAEVQRGYRNVASTAQSWPTHIKQATGEKKITLLSLFLADASQGCTKAGISQPSTHLFSSPSSKDIWAEVAQSAARQESSRAVASSSKHGSASAPQGAAEALRRVMLETCSAKTVPLSSGWGCRSSCKPHDTCYCM